MQDLPEGPASLKLKGTSPMRNILATLAFLVTGTVHAALPQPVSTTDGLLAGELTANNITVFRGIPFAAPPVGQNRWRPPQPVARWSGVRSAENFAPRCIQGGFAPGADQPLTSEDCLYLNVWTPADAPGINLPVFVWLHGGAFASGTGSDPRYDGAALAAKGAVVVTLNYRLGSFGFFAHPELTAESETGSSGNYAMLDIIRALEWVYDNIAGFGGDPINVTLAGESAGANAVANMLASPLAGGLIHRAIMQSGGWMGLGISAVPTLAELEAAGVEQARSFGANSLADLRAASALEIVENFPANGQINVDGWFLPKDPSLIYAANEQQPVDVLTGSNRDEANFFAFGPGPQTLAELEAYASNKFGPLADRYLALYPAANDQQANAAYKQSFNDEIAWVMRNLALRQGERGLGAYVYRFTHVPPGQEATGATHVAELPYMFNQGGLHPEWTATDTALADTMSTYWLRFSASTNPNTSGLPAWPPYRTQDSGNVMILGDTAAAETNQVPSAAALEFFADVFEQLVRNLE
jgi:para-nitrobenzyl esterase